MTKLSRKLTNQLFDVVFFYEYEVDFILDDTSFFRYSCKKYKNFYLIGFITPRGYRYPLDVIVEVLDGEKNKVHVIDMDLVNPITLNGDKVTYKDFTWVDYS